MRYEKENKEGGKSLDYSPFCGLRKQDLKMKFYHVLLGKHMNKLYSKASPSNVLVHNIAFLRFPN